MVRVNSESQMSSQQFSDAMNDLKIGANNKQQFIRKVSCNLMDGILQSVDRYFNDGNPYNEPFSPTYSVSKIYFK